MDELDELDELKLDLERAEETARDPGDDQQQLDHEVNRRKRNINAIADKMRGSVKPLVDYKDVNRSELVCWYCDQKAEEDLHQAELRQLWCTRCKRPWLFSQLRVPVNDRVLPRPDPTPEPPPLIEDANLDDRDEEEAGYDQSADPPGAGVIEGEDLEADRIDNAVPESGTETREEQGTGPDRIETDSDNGAKDDPEEPSQSQLSPGADSLINSTPAATGASLVTVKAQVYGSPEAGVHFPNTSSARSRLKFMGAVFSPLSLTLSRSSSSESLPSLPRTTPSPSPSTTSSSSSLPSLPRTVRSSLSSKSSSSTSLPASECEESQSDNSGQRQAPSPTTKVFPTGPLGSAPEASGPTAPVRGGAGGRMTISDRMAQEAHIWPLPSRTPDLVRSLAQGPSGPTNRSSASHDQCPGGEGRGHPRGYDTAGQREGDRNQRFPVQPTQGAYQRVQRSSHPGRGDPPPSDSDGSGDEGRDAVNRALNREIREALNTSRPGPILGMNEAQLYRLCSVGFLALKSAKMS